MVLDSHTHAWGPDTDAHPWSENGLVDAACELPVADAFTAERLIDAMAAAGIDQAVVVGFPVTEWTDNWYVKRTVREHDSLYGIGLVDPFADDAAGTLRELMAVDSMLGIRLATLHPRDRMWGGEADPDATWLLDALEERVFWEAARKTDTHVQLLSHYTQLDQVVELVETYPELTYAVDHLARADLSLSPSEPVYEPFQDLAAYDNVLLKISAVPYLSQEEYPYEDVHGFLRWAIEEFGRERVVWGSDYPFVSDLAEYEQTLAWLDHVDWLSTTDRQWLTGRALRRGVPRLN